MTALKEMTLAGLHRRVHDIFLGLDLPRNAAILVLGSGEGAFETFLLEQGYTRITSVDLYTAYRVRRGTRFLKLDLNGKAFAKRIGGTYDLVVAMEVIEHVHDTYSFLANCRDLLSRNGKLLISTPNVHWRIARIDYLLTGYPTLFFTKPGLGDHVNPIFKRILDHHCERLGLGEVASYPFGTFWDYARAYRKSRLRSWVYLCALGVLAFVLTPFMLVNKERIEGLDRITILVRRGRAR